MSDTAPPPEFWDPRTRRHGPAANSAYSGMIDTLRAFLDQLAGAALDEATSQALADDLGHWTRRIQPLFVEERDRMFGRVQAAPGHGQVLCPAFAVDRLDAVSLDGRVMFGPYFHGANAAVHGGAVALLFDEILGLPANINVTTLARTAYLHVNYRAITPIGKELQLTARLTSVQGRKRFVHGELKDGDILCAEADGLFLELLAGQQ
jgi:hypothetical protein